ncbi:MAG: DUF1553 domain-containing protein [Verrucomicrobia bacterium]|nr:DUF1553 domain-containing protein [Verrucomicrobiota bacterium]
MSSKRITLFVSFLFGCGSLIAADKDSTVHFNRDIRPILSDNCFNCHGPDQNTRKAKLRLDTPEGAFTERGGLVPITPGTLEKSEVFHRIVSKDPDDLMPPPESNKTLSAKEIDLLKRWIEQGARYEGHWAYIPPQRTKAPSIKNKKWGRNEIDPFILAKLEGNKLKPSPEADRRTLIRRLNFDLVGLPPKPGEVEAFVADKSPKAYEKLVDRLLASPQFGERMAVHWLDLVRYADTVGYHGDQLVSIWPFRDYVIKAFNSNKSFDQFTIEQIAGDLLPDATQEQKVASAYNRLHMMTGEGGAQDKEYRAKYFADRVRTTGSVWLGVTLGCAECHDHKFDPFSAKDFYTFGAFFADLKEKGYYPSGKWEPFMEVPNEEQSVRMTKLNATVARLEKEFNAPNADLDSAQKVWEKKQQAALKKEPFAWTTATIKKTVAKNKTALAGQPDGSVLTSGPNPDKEIYTITIPTDLTNISALRLEALTDPGFANQSLSRANGNFVLTGVEVRVQESGVARRNVKIVRAVADFEQEHHPISLAIDGKPDTGWAVSGHTQAANRQAAFIFDQPIAGGADTILTVILKHESQYGQHSIGRFRLSLSTEEEPKLPGAILPEKLVAILEQPESERSNAGKNELARFFRDSAREVAELRKKLSDARTARDEFKKQLPTTLVSVSEAPKETRIVPRGNWMDDSGEVVLPATPHFLPGPDGSDRRLTRMDLAQWLVSRENPLTARAFVNRLWRMYFGIGLSKVLDDIGSQGEWPTHPELLDNLAVEFMESGWDMKHMVRLMVTSSAYRQGSVGNEKLRETDPFNRLVARQSRFRIPAEMVRDNALSVSDLLSPTMYGASAKPYQPPGYYAQLNFPKREYQPDKGDNQYRRGVYTHWQRTFLHPMLMSFDAPSREECTAERPRSNTPLQSLVLLNDPTFVEAARVFAEKIIQQGGATEDARLKWAYRRALSRDPNKTEQRMLLGLLKEHRGVYTADKAAAEEIIKVGDAPTAREIDPTELAAWMSISRTILNLHETITRF